MSDQIVLHRLNRKEYANAVRDLLLVDVNGAELLPADDSAQGYDNIASALQVSPSFIEQYVIAAHNVAVKAFGNGESRPQGWTFRASPGSQLTHVPGLPLGTRWRHSGKSGSPRRGRIPDQYSRHGYPHLGQRHGVRKPAGSDPRRQDRLSDDNRGRPGYEALRSGAERRPRSRQCAPEEHQVPAPPPGRIGSGLLFGGRASPSPTTSWRLPRSAAVRIVLIA